MWHVVREMQRNGLNTHEMGVACDLGKATVDQSCPEIPFLSTFEVNVPIPWGIYLCPSLYNKTMT